MDGEFGDFGTTDHACKIAGMIVGVLGFSMYLYSFRPLIVVNFFCLADGAAGFIKYTLGILGSILFIPGVSMLLQNEWGRLNGGVVLSIMIAFVVMMISVFLF